MENRLRKILEKKSKIELQVLAKNIGLKGYSRLSHSKIVEKLLVEKDYHQKLKKEIGLKKEILKNPWFIGLVFLLLGILVRVYFSSESVSKEDIESLSDKFDNTETYAKEIEYLEKYRKKFLEKGMEFHYKLYGLKEGKLITKEELRNPSLRINYETFILFDFDMDKVLIRLDFRDFQFDNWNYFTDFGWEESFTISEDKFFDFKAMYSGDRCMKYVLLKGDRVQPIFAIGMGKCQN